MPNAVPTRPTATPILPKPSSPNVFPANVVPTVLCHGPLRRNSAFSTATPRANPRINAQVSSAGGLLSLAVPHTVTSACAAAARSTDALRMPLVINRRNSGSRANNSAGNGVRSRMTTSTWQSRTAPTRSSWDAKCSW